MQNFKTLRQPLMGELAMSPEERERERKKERERKDKKNAIYTFMPAAKGSAHTLLGPIYKSQINQPASWSAGLSACRPEPLMEMASAI